ncbi:sporulation protein YpjB [Oceanobacillus bengalensis]|nr:sporulation protein YpjB [Oceanobacillus bengalensis]
MIKKKLQETILIILIGIVITQLNVNAVEASSNLVILTNATFKWSDFIWPVAIVGGSIVLTLSYVSWRKYKGNQNQRKNSERQND